MDARGPKTNTRAVLRIRGLCAKCGDWYRCDDWFDVSVPTPCCPACGLAPVKIECQRPDGVLVIGMDSASDIWLG